MCLGRTSEERVWRFKRIEEPLIEGEKVERREMRNDEQGRSRQAPIQVQGFFPSSSIPPLPPLFPHEETRLATSPYFIPSCLASQTKKRRVHHTTILFGNVVLDDVRITRVGDGEAANAVVLTAGGTKVDVVASVVVNTSLGEHGVVLNLGLAEGGAVTGDDDELGYR